MGTLYKIQWVHSSTLPIENTMGTLYNIYSKEHKHTISSGKVVTVMYNRSVICKVANNLRKKGYTLSAAFRAAWRLAKSKAAVKVAGVSKYNRQTALDHLRNYAAECVQITLQRESRNTYDSNAIAVLVSVNGSRFYKMGYIPAAIASILSGVIDNITEIKASLQAITGGFYADMMSGLRLNLSI